MTPTFFDASNNEESILTPPDSKAPLIIYVTKHQKKKLTTKKNLNHPNKYKIHGIHNKANSCGSQLSLQMPKKATYTFGYQRSFAHTSSTIQDSLPKDLHYLKTVKEGISIPRRPPPTIEAKSPTKVKPTTTHWVPKTVLQAQGSYRATQL